MTAPLRNYILERLRRSKQLFVDETTAPVLEPGHKKTKIGLNWAYVCEDRPWGGGDPPMVPYVHGKDYKTERPKAHLHGFARILQVNGYSELRGDRCGARRPVPGQELLELGCRVIGDVDEKQSSQNPTQSR